ncbi:MAG: FG-GAP repeat protein [Acidobacteria bacterium]|nr:FG-GAP repeat protein [Acidobacteriota bacterium]MBI3427796.1 FG-GAP repeat protein [Acidobacteriota bacterium]
MRNLAATAALPGRLAVDINANAVATVSAASFEAGAAPDSIVASFGAGLATQNASATTTPLPTQLGGTTVEVNGVRAGLFFVSAGQVNYAIPSTTLYGTANVVIRSGDGTVSNGTIQVVQVTPGIFSANGNGRGAAAAVFLRARSNGTQSFETTAQFNTGSGRFITKPIDLGPTTDQVYLILYMTGLRYFDPPARENISVLIGGEQIPPDFAGAQGGLVGVDQLNVKVPRTLLGRGVISVSVSATGFGSSNLVEIEIAGNGTGPTTPQIMSLTPQDGIGGQAVAGKSLIITGSGFSSDKTANKVYIGPGATEAQVMTATPTRLEVVVPFGVETGTVKVATPNGEGVSTSVVPIVTSISGIIENTNRQPLVGVNVRLSNGASTTTSAEGTFVLADVPATAHSVFIDGDLIPTQPPYPKLTMKIVASANRDNKFASAIALQQATGSSSTIGSGSAATAGGSNLRVASSAQQQQPTPQPPTTNIQTGNFSLQVAANAKPVFPDGSGSGKIYLTPVQNGRTPVDLPTGVYSTSIVQITPFDTKIPEGAKLVFPNDGRAVGASLKLYRYDSSGSIGRFAEVEGAKITISSDGKYLETGSGDVKEANIYFAAQASARPSPNASTTVQGQVLCCVNASGQIVGNHADPVSKANVKARGQEAETDGNGSYILPNVPATAGENITVDVTYRLPSGRVARAQSSDAKVEVGSITKVEPTYLPSESVNRAPVILAPPKVEIPVTQTSDIGLVISDPDPGQQISATVMGASWASLIKVQGTGTIVNANAYLLRLTPPARGSFSLTITADDKQGGTAVHNLTVSVVDQNRPPTANSLDLVTDEDTPLTIKLTGTDPDNNPLTYRIFTPPLNGGLSGTAPNLTYIPNANFNGSDIFTFVVNDGSVNSAAAAVVITVKPVNDAPVLSAPAAVTSNEGQPLVINLTATDVDQGQTLTITGTNLPASATLSATTPTSAQFKWTPSFTQAGNYTVTFKVADNGTPPLSDTKEVKITILDVPTLSVPGPQTVNEGQSLLFDVAVPGGQAGSTVTASNLPEGAALTATSAGIWQFKWTPGYTQAGGYTVTFRAITNGSSESKDVRITVFDAQRELSKEPGDLTIYGAHGPVPRNVLDAGDATGTSVATGDLNGDGIADLVIGAPFANNGTQDVGRDTGAVYVFFGKASLGGTLDLAQQKPDVTLYGERSYDSFGASLAIGDISGDGKPDLIVGAPLADTTDRRDCGKVYALFGPFPPDGLDANKAAIITRIAGLTVNGLKAGDRLGASVAAGHLRSKTGPLDLLIGAPGVDVKSDLAADLIATDAGAVYLFAGGAALSKELDLARTAATYTLLGDTLLGSGQLGSALAVGNFNGDDYDDFATGAPFSNGAFARAAGFAYLVLGNAGLTGTKTATVPNVAFFLSGTSDNDNFGAAVALGDINGDGYADLIMSAPNGDGQNNARQNAGEVFIFYGAAGVQAKNTVIYGVGRTGDAFADALGTNLAVGDFNGDGIADLVIGAPGADLISDKRDPSGAAYLILGTRASLPSTYDLASKAADLTIYGANAGDRLGAGGLAFGNLNGADVPDLVLGIPRSASVNGGRADAGEVRVVYGVRR